MGAEMFPSEIPIDPIMAEFLDMIGKIREGVINLSIALFITIELIACMPKPPFSIAHCHLVNGFRDRFL